MKSFLSEVSEYIINNYNSLKDLEIIVPNNRTKLFLKKYIIENVDKISWMPKITAIEEMFYANSQMVVAEDFVLINKLRQVYNEFLYTNINLDKFYFRGEIILNDFNDIDKYLVDTEKLFANIADIQKIDLQFNHYTEEEISVIKRFWNNININKIDISEQKKLFLELWEKMWDIYNKFTSQLIAEGIAYQGLLYRNVIKNIETIELNKQHYIILGFNALNKCEIKLFEYIKAKKQTVFFWDADNYYIKNENQEAGLFLRQFIKKFPPANNIGIVDKISEKKINIEVITMPSPISQVKLIPEILEKWEKEPDFIKEKTAIILGDENLLMPLMSSIPDNYKEYNISMGFPLKHSTAYNFIYQINMLIKRALINQESCKYYYKDILAVLNHKYLKNNFVDEIKEIVDYMNTNKVIYVDSSFFNKNNNLINQLFVNEKLDDNIGGWLSNICSNVIKILLNNNDEQIIDIEMLNRILSRINIINDCIEQESITIETKDLYFKILFNGLKSLTFAFEGEPLVGLQVMGFIETRCLDFDRVIMLSLNEGIFPTNSSRQSLIPYSLKKFYELPSIEHQSSIFAYYFYRLLQRTKELKILSTAQVNNKSAEISRFVTQIRYELNHSSELNLAYKINIPYSKPIEVVKDERIIECIKSIFKNGISPTAINEYINCKFKFYLYYIEKLKDKDKPDDEDVTLFGRLLHQIIYQLYSKYIGKQITKSDFQKIKQPDNINEAKRDAIKVIYKLADNETDEIDFYEKKIINDIVIKYINQILNYDASLSNLQILHLEETIKTEIKIPQNDENLKFVLLKGQVDRIDIVDNIIRVIDYKTGKTNNELSNLDDLFSEQRKSDAAFILQILLYSFIYHKKNNNNQNICPAIYNVNKLNYDYDCSIKINKEKIDVLKQYLFEHIDSELGKLFIKMLDKKNNFTQTDNVDNCLYCRYSKLCGRNNKK